MVPDGKSIVAKRTLLRYKLKALALHKKLNNPKAIRLVNTFYPNPDDPSQLIVMDETFFYRWSRLPEKVESDLKITEILEYFDGVTLPEYINRLRSVSPDYVMAESTCVRIITQILQGLEMNYYIDEERGKNRYIAHGDLHTGNIMLKFLENGEPLVKIIDYGKATVHVLLL